MPDTVVISDSIGSAVDRRGVGARRWWALGALVMAGLAVGLDATVLSVALPTLARKLHASESDLQWFSSGYLLVLAAAMLPLGLLGDRYGRKKVLLGSLCPVRGRLGGVCGVAVQRRVHRRSAAARDGRGGADRDGVRDAARAVRRGGAPAGGRDHGGGDVRVVAARPDPRRLAVDATTGGVGCS